VGGAPAAAPNEAPVNENQVSLPNPIGNQAPDAPQGQQQRTLTREEAIQRAFDRATKPQPKPERRAEPKAADAKPGHNSPPEEIEKFDLRKRPSEQKGDIQDKAPARGDGGRFVARPQQQPPGAQQQPPGAQQQQPAPQQLPENSPFRDPPQRWSEQAKRDWAAAPETVRGDVHRMVNEFTKAYKVWKPDLEEMKSIRNFQQMAKQHGTTLQQALTNYVSMEQKLRADPIAGLDLIVHNLDLKAPNGQKITFRDIAYHVLTQTPEQLRQVQLGNTQQAAAHQIGSLHQEIADLKSTLQQMHTAQQATHTRSQVDQFAEQHPRFDELGTVIEGEIKLGFDLETAYRRAELLRPATHAAQTRTTSAQTRPVDKSIHGSPDVTPSNGASRRPQQPSRTVNDAVERAMRLNGF